MSLCAGDGGEVETGDIDGAYWELAHDIGGEPLAEETEAGEEVRKGSDFTPRYFVEGKEEERSTERDRDRDLEHESECGEGGEEGIDVSDR